MKPLSRPTEFPTYCKPNSVVRCNTPPSVVLSNVSTTATLRLRGGALLEPIGFAAESSIITNAKCQGGNTSALVELELALTATYQGGKMPRMTHFNTDTTSLDKHVQHENELPMHSYVAKEQRVNSVLGAIDEAIVTMELKSARATQEMFLQKRDHQTGPRNIQRVVQPLMRRIRLPQPTHMSIDEIVNDVLQQNGMIMPPAGYHYPSRHNLKLAKHHSMSTSKEPFPKPWKLPTGEEILDDRVQANRRIKASELRKQKAGVAAAVLKRGLMLEELKLSRTFQKVLKENDQPTGQVERKIDTLSKHVGETPGVTIAADGGTSLMTPPRLLSDPLGPPPPPATRKLYDPKAECVTVESLKAAGSTVRVVKQRTASTNTPWQTESQKSRWADQAEEDAVLEADMSEGSTGYGPLGADSDFLDSGEASTTASKDHRVSEPKTNPLRKKEGTGEVSRG